MAKRRGARAKQGHLDGMEPPSNKKVDAAAADYFEVMQDRLKLTKEEKEAKTNLIETMKAEGFERYETPDGLVVTVTSKSGVKCKRKDDVDGDEEEENDE